MNGHRDKELAEEPEPEVFAESPIEVLFIFIGEVVKIHIPQLQPLLVLDSLPTTTVYQSLLDSFLSQVTSRRGSGGEALVATDVSIFSRYFFILAPYCLISCKHVIIKSK